TYTHPPRGARLVMRDGIYMLFVVPTNGYIRVGETISSGEENRSDIGTQSTSYLESRLPGRQVDYTVAYQGAPAPPPTSPGAGPPAGLPGTVLSQSADLADGHADATVELRRRAVVVLSASYDPGWQVLVD